MAVNLLQVRINGLTKIKKSESPYLKIVFRKAAFVVAVVKGSVAKTGRFELTAIYELVNLRGSTEALELTSTPHWTTPTSSWLVPSTTRL